MTKLPDITPTSGDLATAHARRIQRAVNDLIDTFNNSYTDHPAQPARTAKVKALASKLRLRERPPFRWRIFRPALGRHAPPLTPW
jgi:hypothetical protein